MVIGHPQSGKSSLLQILEGTQNSLYIEEFARRRENLLLRKRAIYEDRFKKGNSSLSLAESLD